MSVMIQVRNVPDELHRKLKSRAALDGRSLSEYLLKELSEVAERPSPVELKQRLNGRQPVNVQESVVEVLRQERDTKWL